MNRFVRVALFATGLACGVAPLASAAPFPSPVDWRNENIYQILTDRYYNGNPSNDNVEASHGSPYAPTANNGIHGGDLQGIQDKLDYIKGLGATAIWISPIVFNVGGTSAYHGYGAQDFYQLAPHWGTMTDLSNMVQAAHARGIKVILDIVCNHTGDLIGSTDSGYPTYKAPPAGYHMSYWNSANQHAFPFNPTNVVPAALSTIFHTNGEIQSFTYPSGTQQVVLGELDGLDDLATETSYVRTNLMNIYTNWVGLADFDGFRVDTAIEVDYGFWQYWCPALHQYATSIGKSNFFMFCEADSGNEQQIGSYSGTVGGGPAKFDATLDYALYYNSVNSVFATASGATANITSHYGYVSTYYDTNSWYRLVTFLDNHDQPRFLSNSGATTNRLTVALQFLYTSRGVPCLYYGTEQAFAGDGNNNDDREDMFAGQWEPDAASVGDNFNETHLLFQQVARMNNFRRLYPALRTGTQNNLAANNSGAGLLAYSRVLSNQEVFVCLNTASSTQILTNCPTTYTPGTVLVNLLNTNDTIVVATGSGTNVTPVISVPSTTAKIYIAQSQVLPLDPVVISQSPAHASTNLAVTTSVVLKFSKPMDTNSVQSAFSVTPATAGNFTWDALQDTMTFTPSAGWLPNTTNLVDLATNAFDSVTSNIFFAPFDTYFVTSTNGVIDFTPPSVFINSPTNGSSITGTVSIAGTATDNIAVASVQVSIDGGTPVTATGTTNWSLSLNTQYLLDGTHTISAQAFDTSGNSSTMPSITVRIINVPGSYLTRISPGDPYTVTDCTANVWVKDQAYSFNSFGYTGNDTTGFVSTAITGICSNAWPLYDWERYSTASGGFSYLFNCPEGVYEIQLLEAETYWTAAGQREFNLFIEGQQVLTNFDIFAAAGGKDIPITLVFTAAVTDAQLEMDFVPGAADNARAGSIQVHKIADVDSDGDGIPDWWMLIYFNHPTGQSNDNSLATDDADGDGMNNLQEYLAGTDPTNPNSDFRITYISISGNDVNVDWTTQLGKTNQLQRSPVLGTNAVWVSVGAPVVGTGSPAGRLDSGAATNPPAFYRVILLQ